MRYFISLCSESFSRWYTINNTA